MLTDQLKNIAKSLEIPWLLQNRPLNSYQSIIGMTLLYIITISVGCHWMRGRKKAFNISAITVTHNLVMCIYSIYAFIGVSLVLLKNLIKINFNPSYLVCDPHQDLLEDMEYWIYTFYISKYIEYLDTIFLVLKAKPVMPPENAQYFLHIYHHAVTSALVWLTIHYQMSVTWVGPLSNTFVHILMYGYYFLAELNKIDRSLGGKVITPIQLAQFLLCLFLMTYETFIAQGCNTHLGAMSFEIGNYIIFFLFFVKIYLDKKKERELRESNKKQQ